MTRWLTKTGTRLLGFLTPVRALVIVLVVVFFWFLVLGDQGLYQLRRLIEMKGYLTGERQAITEEIDALEKEKVMLENPDTLEMVIRRELGYIRPGEVVFEEAKPETETAQPPTASQ